MLRQKLAAVDDNKRALESLVHTLLQHVQSSAASSAPATAPSAPIGQPGGSQRVANALERRAEALYVRRIDAALVHVAR